MPIQRLNQGDISKAAGADGAYGRIGAVAHLPGDFEDAPLGVRTDALLGSASIQDMGDRRARQPHALGDRRQRRVVCAVSRQSAGCWSIRHRIAEESPKESQETSQAIPE